MKHRIRPYGPRERRGGLRGEVCARTPERRPPKLKGGILYRINTIRRNPKVETPTTSQVT